jgi:hypothetical protein
MLIGSGLYWLLSSQLISSFTVLAPYLFQSMALGNAVITMVGIISVSAGLWTLDFDIAEIKRLFSSRNGWVFVVPIVFAASDIYSTLISLSINPRTVELNPFVVAAIQCGPFAIVPFMISYFSLSQGLALLMLRTGRWLFTESSNASFLPFALVCGVSAFGPFSNLAGMGVGYDAGFAYPIAAIASAALCILVFFISTNSTGLRMPVLNRN